jgi:UDP-N-acetylmuramyl pentapeptide phosphotransferase/UDP-N-acetylglucosamine-1-phosphate transferase
MIWLRQKDDPFNAVIAGFVTGGVLAARSGASNAFKNAVIGGGILFLIEGVSIIMQAVMMRKQHIMQEEFQKEQIAQMEMQQKQAKNPWDTEYDEAEATGSGSAQNFNF